MRKSYRRIFRFCVLTLMIAVGIKLLKGLVEKRFGLHEKDTLSSFYLKESSTIRKGPDFKITWYSLPIFLNLRHEVFNSGFEGCKYNNCKLSFNASEAGHSDAIIFQGGYHFPRRLKFKRRNGQVWIFYEHEPPYRYRKQHYSWIPKNAFNWTMTYDRSISDIHLPYGEITNKSREAYISEDELIRSKKRTALMIMSHCNTPANRLKYVTKLRKFIDVDILGACGTKWTCGIRFKHDDCFKIINQYKFFLAFENSFCNNYFSEKVFDNFDYDTVMVTRGGRKGQINQILPVGTFLSTDDFKNAKELGLYLKSIKNETYLNIIRRKQQFTSFRSYESVFQKAMCEICERMNNADMYKKTIEDIDKWAFSSSPCRTPDGFE